MNAKQRSQFNLGYREAKRDIREGWITATDFSYRADIDEHLKMAVGAGPWFLRGYRLGIVKAFAKDMEVRL